MPHPGLLPLSAGIAVALVAAFLQSQVHRVPNSLTLRSLALAWICGLVLTILGGPGGGLLSSVAGALLGGLLLLPPFLCGALGAGCVKAQMSFGAWIGCALELAQVPRLILFSTMAGVVLTIVMYAVASCPRPAADDDAPTGDDAPRDEFNAQLPLSLGSIAGLITCFAFDLI